MLPSGVSSDHQVWTSMRTFRGPTDWIWPGDLPPVTCVPSTKPLSSLCSTSWPPLPPMWPGPDCPGSCPGAAGLSVQWPGRSLSTAGSLQGSRSEAGPGRAYRSWAAPGHLHAARGVSKVLAMATSTSSALGEQRVWPPRDEAALVGRLFVVCGSHLGPAQLHKDAAASTQPSANC